MRNIEITEEELNRAIEEEPSNSKLELESTANTEEKTNESEDEKSIFLEYTLDERGWDKELRAQEINMNPYSISFFIKSLFCGNSGAVYMSTFINFFQELDISTIEEPNLYSSYSHAATLFILKTLEKNGVVKIIEYSSTPKTESLTIGNFSKKTPKKTKIKMYDVLFYKLRDLKKEDCKLISEIERTLRISKRQVRVRFFEGEMYISLGILEMLKCVVTGHIFVQLKKNIAYWKNAEGFKNDVVSVLYNLTRNKKPTTK